jgi:hypothetical protein
MVRAFEFFGCIPKEVWWDNPKTVATLILQGRERRLHPRYAALASHYVFDPLFCMPARGHEKPDAEGTVKAVQRRFATPVPRVADIDELNMYFFTRCKAEPERTVQSTFGPFQIGTRLAEEKVAATPLPKDRFDPCGIRPAVPVDQYQTVACDCNRSSVPRSFAFPRVTVKGHVDQVVIVARGQVIATPPRCLERHTMVLDPIPYLATLGRRPAALDHSPVYRDWKLPAGFADVRAEWQALHGTLAGDRRFVRVLQLLSEHPLEPGRQAVEACRLDQLISAEAAIQRTHTLAAIEPRSRGSSPSDLELAAPPQVHVPLPDLSRFNLLRGDSAGQDDARAEAFTSRGDDASPDPPSARSPCSSPDRMRRDYGPGSTGELGLPLAVSLGEPSPWQILRSTC